MTGNEYQDLARRTQNKDIAALDHLYHGIFGLNSEAGEVAGLLQKIYQGHNLNIEHLKKELGDCLWMIAEICDSIDCDLDDVMQMNIDKLKERYPEGFDAEHSLHRAEGDI